MELNILSYLEGLLDNEKLPMFNISSAILIYRKLFLLSVITWECTKLISFRVLDLPLLKLCGPQGNYLCYETTYI
jgi:hypothetical protein